jgi:hypothetical protein
MISDKMFLQNEPKPQAATVKKQSQIRILEFLGSWVLVFLVVYAKQSVRQAKLVQSSRFQSCPVKGSLQAGI